MSILLHSIIKYFVVFILNFTKANTQQYSQPLPAPIHTHMDTMLRNSYIKVVTHTGIYFKHFHFIPIFKHSTQNKKWQLKFCTCEFSISTKPFHKWFFSSRPSDFPIPWYTGCNLLHVLFAPFLSEIGLSHLWQNSDFPHLWNCRVSPALPMVSGGASGYKCI